MSALDFKSLFDASPNPFMVLDANLRYVTANPAYLATTGVTLEHLVGKSVPDAFPANRGTANERMVLDSFARVLQTKQPDYLALIAYHVAGEDRFWSATHTPILDAQGNVAFILQHTVDITELSAIRDQQDGAGVLDRARAVQEQAHYLRRLFEQAPGFVAILRGPQHVFEITNAAYVEVIGGRDVIGKSVAEALPEVVEQGFLQLLDDAYATGKPFIGRSIPIQLQRGPSGELELRHLDFIYQPFTGPDGKTAGIFVQGSDITEQKRLADERDARAEEAERANRLKDEFLATVSHELRTPLTSMLGWLQLLNANQVKEDRRASVLDTVHKNARSLAQIVDDILDVSRIIAGKMSLKVEPTRVGDPIEAAIESLRPAADAKGIRLDSTIDSEAHVLGDVARLQQVVWNLLTNAIKFTPKGGRVHVVARRINSSVEISVRDNGAGIDPQFIPYVFERFRQADGKSTRAHGGLGLGLAIVKSLVEMHGGTVSAESAGEGRGSLFVVTLPVSLSRFHADVTTPESRSALGCPPEIHGLRMLIVEDEDDTRELLKEILMNCGVKVETAASVREGMELFEKNPPDILISDVGMPEENGYSFIKRIRALPEDKGGRVPAVALTAYARAEDRTNLLRAGFKAHVPKPVEIPELLAVLAALAG